MAMACYSPFDVLPPAADRMSTKDYSRPLHVDCSVEYELPSQAKPPPGVKHEPLLMIHPCYYRRAESQRRSPFINNLPSGRVQHHNLMAQSSRRSRTLLAPPVPHHQSMVHAQRIQQHHIQHSYQSTGQIQPQHQMRFNEQRGETQHHSVHHVMQAWPGAEPSGVYKSTKTKKNEQLEAVGAARGSGSDSGVSGGHWTDSERSPLAPEVRLQRDFVIGGGGADSGIATPVSVAEDKGLADIRAVECPSKEEQPAVGVAAVASCKACRRDQHSNYQRLLQQPWAGVTAPPHFHTPAVPSTRNRTLREETQVRRSAPWLRTAKRSRTSDATLEEWPSNWLRQSGCREKDCKSCCSKASGETKAGEETVLQQQQQQQWNSYYGHCRGASEDGSRILWNNENSLRLFQV